MRYARCAAASAAMLVMHPERLAFHTPAGKCNDGGKKISRIQSACRWQEQTQSRGRGQGLCRCLLAAPTAGARPAALLMPPCFIHSLQALSTASAAEPLRLLWQ